MFLHLLSLDAPSSSSLLESINSGDFGAFFGCGVFLTFFSGFVAVFFPLLDPNAFLGFCSCLLGSSMGPSTYLGSSSPDAFLGCETLLAFLLHLL